MKKFLVLSALLTSLIMYACNNGEQKAPQEPAATSGPSAGAGANPSYDPERGIGKFTHVNIPDKLDPSLASAGEQVYNVKCSACHRLTAEKLVGPGWKGVSQRHKPEWIMNFITNTDEMIDKDPKARAQLELCMVRMPNQNLGDDAARNIFEYMRKNDGVK